MTTFRPVQPLWDDILISPAAPGPWFLTNSPSKIAVFDWRSSAGAPFGSAGAPFGSASAPFRSAGAPQGSAGAPFFPSAIRLAPVLLQLAPLALQLDPWRSNWVCPLPDPAPAASWLLKRSRSIPTTLFPHLLLFALVQLLQDNTWTCPAAPG